MEQCIEICTEHSETLQLPLFVDLEINKKQEVEDDDYLTEDPLDCSPKIVNDIDNVDGEKDQEVDVKSKPIGNYGGFSDVRDEDSECTIKKVHSDSGETSGVEELLGRGGSVGDSQECCRFTFLKVEEADVKFEVEEPLECYGGVGDVDPTVATTVKVEEADCNLEDVSNTPYSEQQLISSECVSRSCESQLTQITPNHDNANCQNIFFGENSIAITNGNNEKHNTDNAKQLFDCNHCLFKTNKLNRLTEHMRKHTNEKPFACSQCPYRAATRRPLVTHIRTHTGDRPFACDQCPYKAAQRGHLVRHMITHTSDKPFACSECSYRAARRDDLVTHMITHSNDKPFACSQCSFRAALRGSLVRHMRTHTCEKPFACNQCPFRAIERASLARHMRTHTKEKPFACNQCPYRAAQSNALVTHIRTHTNEKPFVCIQCSYRATTRSYLRKHMRTHTNEKPFACSQCPFTSSWHSALVTHMTTHTNDKPFACTQCSYRAARRSYLVSHIRTHK